MDIRISKVEASAQGDGWGKRIGPGAFVDLDERLAPGVTVRDQFPEEWFEAPAREPWPVDEGVVT